MTERYVVAASVSCGLHGVQREYLRRAESEVFRTVSAIFWSEPSMVMTAGSFSSCSLCERNATVSKLASDSAEQPAKAA